MLEGGSRLGLAAAIAGLAFAPGCATRPVSLDQAPKMQSREEVLRRLGRPAQVEQEGECQVWRYRHHYWNLFTLTSDSWEAQYTFDATGEVRSVDIQESSSSRRLWPRTKLPEDFQEFK